MTKDNLKLWSAVCETDPKHTKKVKFGRGFTAIDPMWQVYNATAQFGAAGDKWGWEVRDTHFLPTDFVGVLVRVWHGDRDTFIEQYGQCGMFIDNAKQKPDEDCLKKATTDGLTKCLSYFGFNADVFLGKFDDNKYVAQMTEKHKELSPQEAKEKEFLENVKVCLDKINDLGELHTYKTSIKPNMSEFAVATKNAIATAFKQKEAALQPTEAAA